MFLMKLFVQLVDFCSGLVQGFPTAGRDLVDPSPAPTYVLQNRLQEPTALQTMQERVKSPGSDPISVMRQLLHHGQPEDWLVSGMHQHMDADESGK